MQPYKKTDPEMPYRTDPDHLLYFSLFIGLDRFELNSIS